MSYLPSVWRFVYARVAGDSHLAEDIVSETVPAIIHGRCREGTPHAWQRV
jgi:DNA-directed RNA polymerase specialized sigma24 family protein